MPIPAALAAAVLAASILGTRATMRRLRSRAQELEAQLQAAAARLENTAFAKVRGARLAAGGE